MDGDSSNLTETHGQDGRAPFRAASVHRVLAVRGGALGDFILTWPSLRALREAGYEVELLTRPAYGRLAFEAGLIAGWRDLDAPEAALLMVKGTSIDETWRAWLSGFDAVVSWVPDADGAFQSQMLASGAGRFYQGDGRCRGGGPAAGQLAEAVAFAGMPIRPVDDLFAGEKGLESGQVNRIAFHPGSGSGRKNWPLPRWMEVMQALSRKHPETTWLVITGEVEEERLPEIGTALDRAGLRWESVHGLDLPALCRRLRGCRAFLGHDSGVSHLAAACGVPCRLLFGPTDPAVWAPLGGHIEVLTAPQHDLMTIDPGSVIGWLGMRPL